MIFAVPDLADSTPFLSCWNSISPWTGPCDARALGTFAFKSGLEGAECHRYFPSSARLTQPAHAIVSTATTPCASPSIAHDSSV